MRHVYLELVVLVLTPDLVVILLVVWGGCDKYLAFVIISILPGHLKPSGVRPTRKWRIRRSRIEHDYGAGRASKAAS